ncbi:hypothetical protein BV25DRAFT_691555 [Artomyces pyxidatus]|uniref:Uncharacterized protein n=1 Tax=Artomyces pyxidatus TaxID=48021 RepID=A0ACB8T008_9AGAM|nr:hypothetical protein BV25DRAFT_691555 [Artomyces pyxidatus]
MSTPDDSPRGLYLAPEMWLEIFEWATFVPHLMNIDVANPFDYPGTSSTIDNPWSHVDLDASLHQRLTLILVCKTWYSLANPILYRCLVVRNKKAAICLGLTLKASRLRCESSDSAEPAVGSFVRHLVVRLRERCDLADIARHLPNLSILTAFNLEKANAPLEELIFIDDPPDERRGLQVEIRVLPPTVSFMQALVETCGPFLRKLDIDGFPKRDDPNAFPSCLDCRPSWSRTPISESSTALIYRSCRSSPSQIQQRASKH